MERIKRLIDGKIEPADNGQVEDLPIRVAEDWDSIIAAANTMADVIDRHLDFESKLQGRELKPITLCPEQRVSLTSDLAAV